MLQIVRQDKLTINDKNITMEQLKLEINRLKQMNKNNIFSNSQHTTAIDESHKTPINNSKRFFDPAIAEKHTTEEWGDILKNINITNDSLERLGKNPTFSKVLDALELMNKVVVDKNMQIKIINTENENLNRKNSSLIEENMKFSNNLMKAKAEMTNQYKTVQTNVSMVILINIAQ
jgi:hypothetical protein